MGITAQVVDGKVVANYTKDNNLTERKTGSDSLNKDAFMQILVAEMQYQDPLEPSSNTEWVTQMSSFTQVEELTDLGKSVQEQSANDLVGKRVVMAVEDEHTNEKQYVTGVVQCTEKIEDEVYLSINDNLYKAKDLYSVVDEDYFKSVLSEGTANA